MSYFKHDDSLPLSINQSLCPPGLFFFNFRHFKQTLQFLQQIKVKNIHLVYGTGIRTRDLQNMSLLP